MSSFPVRCFTCGKPIAQHWPNFVIKKILNGYGIGRICCMRMFMTHTDIEHIQILYPTHKDNIERLGVTDKKSRPENYKFKVQEEIESEDEV
jgi:DNA-directed RNA polymerase subunit N